MKNVFEFMLAMAMLWSCEKQVLEKDISVTVSCELSKGVMVGTDEISNLNVFAYKDSILCAQAYSEAHSLEIELHCGYTYSLYVLANLGEISPPASESKLASIRCELSDGYLGGPAPMVSKSPKKVTVSEDSRVTVEVERLISICRFKVDKQFETCDFILKGAKLYQVPVDICPFADESAASKTIDGDYVSNADIVNLNAGGSADFWLLENCQGVLLPGNTYQWMKVPESIREKQNLCTYLEVNGRFIKNGMSATVLYRMYLGRDNCTDFTIPRNTVNELTLTLTDEGIEHNSWQVVYYGI